ncbi:putative sporulation protein YtxC [Bacillus tianshenii]|nr:putative sporulation protein YtxC [Bacillus tianshenii]
MIAIHFRKGEEAASFYDALRLVKKKQDFEIERHFSPENIIRIHCGGQSVRGLHTWLIPIMRTFIVTTVENRWMQQMIRQMFYFTDEEEQEQILSIARSLLDGEKEDVIYQQRISKQRTHIDLIEEALQNFLTPNISFSFESFLHFRLKEYQERLFVTVEAAIDEYKLEQEYQAFVEHLRHYLSEKPPLYWELHVVDEEEFQVFLPSGSVIERERLLQLIDEELWRMNDLDAGASVIAPLISIAPARLYIYTNEPDRGVVRTLQNIFLERISIHAKRNWGSLKQTRIDS